MDSKPIVVLLVEDNPDHAELVKRNLAEYQVANFIKHAVDGEDALNYLFHRGKYADFTANPPPDVILLDLRLPRVSGHDVLREIRASEEYKNLPVVVLTTSDADEDIIKAYGNHVNSYLVKPVNFEKFTRLMKDLGFYWLVWNQYPRNALSLSQTND